MTKITNELLEDYAMLYPRIECVKMGFDKELLTPLQCFIKCDMLSYYFHQQLEYIQLRSIESITDEELDKACELLVCQTDRKWLIESFYGNWSHNTLLTLSFYKYLQSIGIATPTIDKEGNIITVDELVESGKLKLIK